MLLFLVMINENQLNEETCERAALILQKNKLLSEDYLIKW